MAYMAPQTDIVLEDRGEVYQLQDLHVVLGGLSEKALQPLDILALRDEYVSDCREILGAGS